MDMITVILLGFLIGFSFAINSDQDKINHENHKKRLDNKD